MLICAVWVLTSSHLFSQAWKPEIGYTDLVAELGGELEDGAGLSVMQVEARRTVFERGATGAFVDADGMPLPAGAPVSERVVIGIRYMPNPRTPPEPQFAGKTFTDGTGSNFLDTTPGQFNVGDEFTAHARTVGRNFYGNSSSMTAGITDITGFDADGYLGDVLGINTGNDPAAGGFDIGNHSYVGRATGAFTAAIAEDILERFDFVINRDNTVMVVGADNNSARPTPRVLAPSYNAITVGRSDGFHSQGLTPNYGAPRFATHIVVPSAGATSFSTPVVSSAVALLRDAGDRPEFGTDFIQNEVIRSVLFSGATKDEFADWDRTSDRPMDEVFGFGELNILNSYHIMEDGQFEGSVAEPASDIGLLGWDYGDFDGSNDLFYDFTIDAFSELSSVLSWNMEIIDEAAGNPNAFVASRNLADLNLDLFDSSDSFLGTLVDSSNGSAYNNEHIFLRGLSSGDYTFRISGDSATDFGFSWRINAVPEPSGLFLLSVFAATSMARRRRKAVLS